MNALASLEPQPVMPVVTIDQAAIRLADEGIPVRAIARSLKTPSSDVYEILQEALLTGQLLEMPRDDWPTGTSRSNRVPLTIEDDKILLHACARCFRLTKLEVAVFTLLVKRTHATKEQLHHAIKQTRPGDNREEIDPKIVDVVICHIRKKLKVHEIKIETMWAVGYLIPAHDRDTVATMLNNMAQEIISG